MPFKTKLYILLHILLGSLIFLSSSMIIIGCGPELKSHRGTHFFAADKKINGSEVLVESDEESDITGALSVWVEDPMPGIEEHQLKYFLSPTFQDGEVVEEAAEKVELVFAEQQPTLQTGTIVRAQGRKAKRGAASALVVSSSEKANVYGEVNILAQAEPLVTGNQQTLILALDFSDKALDCSIAQVNNMMFSSATSIDAYYRESTFANVSFSGDVKGPFRINASAAASCSMNAVEEWANQADAAARNAGINLSTYNRFVYMFPRNSSCPWAGLGVIGGRDTRSWINGYCNVAVVTAHELGHNLGMYHASTAAQEYGDRTDVMGNSGMFHANSAHKTQMGWVEPARVIEVKGSGSFTLESLETPSQNPAVLKIRKSNSPSDYYYVGYRQPAGFDARINTAYVGKISVHSWNGKNNTFFLQALGDNESFLDAASQLTITQTSHDTQSAQVTVKMANSGCSRNVPSLSLSPAMQSGDAGASLTYQVTLRNNDADCSAERFELSTSGPTGWQVSVTSPGSIASGASYQGTLRVTSVGGASAGNYKINVLARHASVATSEVESSVTYSVRPRVLPAQISAVVVGSVTANSVILSWRTDVPATSQVEYGLSTNYSAKSALNTNLVREHTLSLMGLMPNTTYHYRVLATNAQGISSNSSDFVFTTVSGSENNPEISNLAVADITDVGAVVSWLTNVASNSQLEYGPSNSLGISVGGSAGLFRSHVIRLKELSPDTLYYFRVRSEDAGGKVAISEIKTFRTANVSNDTRPPIFLGISGVRNSAISAKIFWETNEQSTTQVEFGYTRRLGRWTAVQSSLTTQHVQSISGLYYACYPVYFRVRSVDGSGNEAVSGIFALSARNCRGFP